MTWIFGYGSIMNPSSAEKTLKRPISENGHKVAILKNHTRIWRVVTKIKIKNNISQEYPAVFLDIIANDGIDCIGTILEVNASELIDFDVRETPYNRVNVRNLIFPPIDDDVFAYFGKDEFIHPPNNAVVMARYEQIVDKALSIWGDDFAVQYEKSTIKHNFPLIDGEYIFDNTIQNTASGR